MFKNSPVIANFFPTGSHQIGFNQFAIGLSETKKSQKSFFYCKPFSFHLQPNAFFIQPSNPLYNAGLPRITVKEFVLGDATGALPQAKKKKTRFFSTASVG